MPALIISGALFLSSPLAQALIVATVSTHLIALLVVTVLMVALFVAIFMFMQGN